LTWREPESKMVVGWSLGGPQPSGRRATESGSSNVFVGRVIGTVSRRGRRLPAVPVLTYPLRTPSPVTSGPATHVREEVS
jgi:hypothetical protein